MPKVAISRCGGTPAQSFTEAVFQVAATNQLIAYWTLCDGSSPYADTSGHNPSVPATMVLQANSDPMTQDFTPGPLAANDCGAVGFNVDSWVGSFSPSEYLFANTSDNRFDGSPLSICTFVRFNTATLARDRGICGNISMAAGAPDYRVGMGFLQLTTSNVLRFSNGQHSSGGTWKYVDTPAGLVVDTWYFVAGTWDGTTLTLYVNGVSVGTTADSGTAYHNNNGFFIGRMNNNGIFTSMYGQTAQTTVWAAALSPADQGVLAAAAGY